MKCIFHQIRHFSFLGLDDFFSNDIDDHIDGIPNDTTTHDILEVKINVIISHLDVQILHTQIVTFVIKSQVSVAIKFQIVNIDDKDTISSDR